MLYHLRIRVLSVAVALFAVCVSFLLRPLVRLLRGYRTMSVWTGAPIINMAINARAERSLGVRTRSIVMDTYFTTAEFDVVLRAYSTSRWWGWIAPFVGFAWICLTATRVHAYCDRG